MITAVFQNNDDYAHAYGLWQWDYGQQLRIEGLHLPTAVEIHFALQETGGEAITRVGTTKDGVTTVTIPDSMLEGNRATWTADKAYNIYAWVYLSDKSSGETIKRITMQVKSRPKPEAFEAPGDGEIFHEAIEAVNDAAKRAEEAGDKAVSAADEAKAAATQTAEHLQVVQGLAEQVETNADTVAQDKQTVTGMLSQTQQAASDAALSAQAAKLSETAAAQAQTGAEAAEDGARQYAEDTGADRQAVTEDKQAVSQMREDVAADRQAVEQTALQFGQTSQDALTAIGQAQSTAVGAVKAEGNKQTTAVQEAGTQAVSEVTEAKTTAVQAVTTEGDTQTKRVEDAAAGIVADREQINQNKTDIAGLVEGMTDLAPAILNTASGSVITADDAAEGRPFRGLRVFGRTEQVRTTGAQLLDESKVEQNNFRAFKYINLSVGEGTFTLSSNIPKSSTDSSAYIMLISGNVQEISSENTTATNGVYKGQSRTFPSINRYVTIAYRNDANANNIINFNDYWYMLNKGAEEKPYEPYTGGKPSPSPEYPQEIVSAGESGNITVEVGGKNLFDADRLSNGNFVEFRGVECYKYVDTDKGFAFDFSKNNSANQLTFTIKMYRETNLNNATGFRFEYSDGTNESHNIKHDTPKTVVTTKGKILKKITSMHAYNEVCYIDLSVTQLEYGTVPTPYEPPRIPQTLTLQTPNGLPGIPVSKDGNYTDADGQQWICDEIDLGRGKYVQRIEEHILKSKNIISITNSRQINSEYYGVEYNGCTKDFVGKFGNGVLCDKLAFVKPNSNINGHEITYVPGNGIIVFGLKKSLVPSGDLDEIRNYITSNNFAFLILIDSPIEKDLAPEEITEYKKTHTNYPTTVITNDAGAHMEVSYVADTKAYIDKKFKELNQAIVNTQIALL